MQDGSNLNKVKVFRVKTKNFILPHFLKLGSYITGKILINNTGENWCNHGELEGDAESDNYLEEVGFEPNDITHLLIKKDLRSPFLPLISGNFIADAYGNIYSQDEESSVIKEKISKILQEKYERSLKLINRLNLNKRQRKLQIKKINKVFKKKKAKSKFLPAYTDMGVVFCCDKILSNSLMAMELRARRFCQNNNIEIAGFELINYEDHFLNNLSQL